MTLRLHDITTGRSMHYAETESPIKAKFCAWVPLLAAILELGAFESELWSF